ncbi:MAG TPA: hypothetical protein VGK67_32480 [Myxococcales bacterium]|jgi:hypothetical protein
MRRTLLATALVVSFAQACSETPAGERPDAATPTPADAARLLDASLPAPDADAPAPGLDAAAPDDAALDAPDAAAPSGPDAASEPPDAAMVCNSVSKTAALALAAVPASDEYFLRLTAYSTTATSWGQSGKEAVILEVLNGSAVLDHLVLHQGSAPFGYSMHLGTVTPDDHLSVRVSGLSAAMASPFAKVCDAAVVPVSSLGTAIAEGARRAPILKWPVKKRFDDLPVLLGWSKARQKFEMVYTSENGGTVQNCGGGAAGMQAEFARWGRGCDIEGLYDAGTGAWGACDASDPGTLRFEGEHPVLYFGDNHNRLYSSRGGYGQACGTGSAEMTDGPLDGFNVNNPGNEAAKDGPFVITVRHVPVDLDALGYDQSGGRREGLLDRYAPWIYRLTALELSREGKVDGTKCLPMDRYLYVDVQVDDVGGSGDSYCSLTGASSGFKLRVNTSDGKQLSSGQMTADYAGGAMAWKRMAIPLDQAYSAGQLASFVFDAYDNDGIYLMAIGDAFMPRALGDNGASLEVVHSGASVKNVYVDDDSSGCVGGNSSGGPADAGYPCVGGAYTFAP